MTDDRLRQMREASRQRMRLIWEMSGLDESRLSDEDRGLVEVMRMHPEYYDLWGRLDEVTDEELERDGSNPVIHLIIHQTVENQISANDPPETAKALERLMKRGRTRHDALHEIGAVVAEEMFDILKSDHPFNEQRFIRGLHKLGRPPRKQKRRQRKKF
jgi:hypothetical protein